VGSLSQRLLASAGGLTSSTIIQYDNTKIIDPALRFGISFPYLARLNLPVLEQRLFSASQNFDHLPDKYIEEYLTMDDRRSKPRLDVSLDASWDRDQPVRITNLSEGGCYLDTVGEVRRGEIVGFRVLLSDGDFLYLEGEVRHYTAGVGFGVQFVDLNDEQVAGLKRLIEIATQSGPERSPISASLVEE
jgi:PilZ domain